MNEAPIQILMVEDDYPDAFLTKEMLKTAKVANTVNVVSDGVAAMEYLRRQGKHATARRPDLILLDLNLPRKDGRQVLAEVKADPELRGIPVVVLTSSQAEVDVARSYADHANCYIVKPVDLDGLMEVVKSIEGFWVSIVALPATEGPGSER
jgi:two-component system, chemotaxis family, response regulator Rcp1